MSFKVEKQVAYGIQEVPPVHGYRVEFCAQDYVFYFDRADRRFLLQRDPRQLLPCQMFGGRVLLLSLDPIPV